MYIMDLLGYQHNEFVAAVLRLMSKGYIFLVPINQILFN